MIQTKSIPRSILYQESELVFLKGAKLCLKTSGIVSTEKNISKYHFTFPAKNLNSIYDWVGEGERGNEIISTKEMPYYKEDG